MTAINPQQIELENEFVLYDAGYMVAPESSFFEVAHWREKNALLNAAPGRGSAWFFRYDDSELVLRHYHRGGLMAKLSDDCYQWSGLEKTRAWREWRLLAEMFQQGLPVPQPVAARVQRSGLFYRADLVTLRLPNTKTLADVLEQRSLSENQWQALGDVIRHFHDAGIFHADLNARNVLVNDQDEIFLIDFDKGEKRAVSDSWQQANLDRLQRSLEKFRNNNASFHYDDQAVKWLRKGYESADK